MQLKNIRFNLKFFTSENEYELVRSLSDLSQKLNVDDLFEYYFSGQLHRWLIVQGETGKAEVVNNINRKASVEAQLKELFIALDFDVPAKELKSLLDSYFYHKQITASRVALKNRVNEVSCIVKKEFENYTNLLKDIIALSEDFSAVKAKVRSLLLHYPEHFKIDFIRFYDVMAEKCPLAIFAVLMDANFRKYFQPVSDDCAKLNFYGSLADQFDSFPDRCPATAMKRRIDKFFSATRSGDTIKLNIDEYDFSDSYLLRENKIIKEVDYSKSGGEWQDAVDKGTPVMILHCDDETTIRPSDDKEHQYKGNELPEKFMIFDGLDFRTSSSSPRSSQKSLLLYMEVK